METHLQIETDENLARGMSLDEARAAARRRLGNPTLIREEIYRMNTVRFLESLWQDLRYAARMLRLNPAFSLVAIASLALGIGANTGIFRLLDAVRLRALPVKNPRELAAVRIANFKGGCCSFNTRYAELTYAQWEQIRDHQQAFSDILAWGSYPFNLAIGGEARPAQVLMVSGNFFHVLGVPPVAGRVLTPADDRRGCGSPSAVISHAFWQREYGGDPHVAGRKFTLEGHPFEIAGVTPAGFFGVDVGQEFDAAIPLCAEPIVQGEYSVIDRRDGWWLASLGRLKPGWSLARASAHLEALSPALFRETLPANLRGALVQNYLGFKLGAAPGEAGFSSLRTEYGDPLWLLLGITALVLLIACANLANLLLARASAREREVAVRLAVGASRGRLIRQLLAESLLLAALGSLLGAWLAGSLSGFLVASLSTRFGRTFVDLSPDGRVLAFTAGVGILTCLLFGLVPAIRATRTAPATAMKGGGRGLTTSRERFGLRRALVVSQVALSLVLLVASLLFVRSFRNLVTLDAGFRQDGILEADFNLGRLRIPPERRLAFRRDLVARVGSVPGVASAAEVSIVPLSGSVWQMNVVVGPDTKGGALLDRVSPGYFATLGTPLVAGRDFGGRDTRTSPGVAIVNESFARQYLGTGNPIGRTFRLERMRGEPDSAYEVVGLVRDTKYRDIREDFRPIAYFPAAQDAQPDLYPSVMIRSNVPAPALIAAVKRAMAELNPDIGFEFHVFRSEIRKTLLREQLMASLSGFFGLLAAMLATIGLYGVMSYMVARRRDEIGIRMALGAGRGDVSRLILGEAVLLLGVGLAVGTGLALAAGRATASMLFGLEPRDPAAILAAVGLLAAAAVVAGYLPARRAARLYPMTALRQD